MSIGEAILLRLSRRPGADDYAQGGVEWELDRALDPLLWAFPDFLERIHGRAVVDFGCSSGAQAVAMAQHGAASVLGVDIDRFALERARLLAEEQEVSDRVTFVEAVEPEHEGRFDVVVSQNSMEHFSDPAAVLRTMTSVLREDGVILMHFGPPWYAPYGSHMHFFTKVPWVNILFSEETVMRVRARFRNDGAMRYADVENGLNQMTLRKFEALVAESGLVMLYRRYRCIKGLDGLSRLPLLRELLVNHVVCILAKAGSRHLPIA